MKKQTIIVIIILSTLFSIIILYKYKGIWRTCWWELWLDCPNWLICEYESIKNSSMISVVDETWICK